ncbi:hypothetical protein NLM33_45260 [Bradyrhizobium sp. CCGUVB1N3]|uniref:hypothetical protein n=1 Tax=Bradyrhizobium sp. CCGUVB1N3 TaxID=2949629 RepID=UPI0020B2B456|nr:hypothetical protein [Bradyrhizobium sp. CCGUVB1N3]MCP3477373.1 hypothetical protein [Bradyrhizobium sp. CCGUVB1N3]
MRIGIDRQIMAAALLRRLASAGVLLNEPFVAADWLAPLLCTSARDQGALRARLAAEMRTSETETTELAPVAELVQPIKTLSRAEDAARTVGRNWLVWIGIASFITILLALLIDPTSPLPIGPFKPNGTGPTPTLPATWLDAAPVYLATLVGIIMAVIVLRSRHRERVKVAVSRPDEVPPFLGGHLAWFSEGSLRTSLRSLRRHLSPHGYFLNLPLTVRKTVRHAGVPIIVRGGRPKLPEHVVLAELNHAEDQMRVPVEALLRCLREGGVHSDAYAFFGRPHIAHRWAGGQVETLDHVALRHYGARLLVISDGRPFYDRLADAAINSAPIDEFSERILLVPELTTPPSFAVQALRRAGWFVVEFRTEGIRQIAEWLLSPREYEVATEEATADEEQPSPQFQLEPALLDGRKLPSPQRAALLLDQLREWLGERAFALLAILAVQPRLSPATTDGIAGHLTLLGVPMPGESSLARLANLPWMRRGELPNWLRIALVDRIPKELRETARSAWLLYMAGEAAPRRYSTATTAAVISPDDLSQLREIALERMDPSDRSDPLMKGMIGERVGSRRVALNDLDWRTGFAVVLTAATVAFAAYFVVTHAQRLGGLIFRAAQSIEPVARDITNLGLVAIALLFFAPRYRIVNAGLAALATLAAAVLMLAALAAEPLPAIRHLCIAEGLMATIAYRWFSADAPSPLVVRALFSLAHPWANAAVVTVLIGYAASGNLQRVLEGSDILLWIEHEFAMLSIGAFMAWSLGTRMISQGAAPRPAIAKAASLYVVGQALAGVAFFLVVDAVSVPLFDISWSDHKEFWWPLDANARLIGGIAAGLLAFEQPRWQPQSPRSRWIIRWRLLVQGIPFTSTFLVLFGMAFGVVLPIAFAFSPQIAQFAANIGIPNAAFRTLTIYGPWLSLALVGLVLLIAWNEEVPASERRPLVGLLALAVAVPILHILIPTITDDPTVTAVFRQLSWLMNWLLLWPIIRTVRSDLVVAPRDGLWWRCLLLVPCALSVLRLGGFHQLALPVSAWIAAHYGARALPAMSLALVPMMLCIAIDRSFVAVSPALGWALAALLAAMFATDARLRASVLTQDRVTTPQMVILCLLMIELDVGNSSLRINADLYPLALILLAFIGLSRAPLHRLIVVLAVVELTGALLQWGSNAVDVPVFRFFLGYPGLAGFVTVVLVLVMTRLIRSAIDAPPRVRRSVGTAPLSERMFAVESPFGEAGSSELRARVSQIDLPRSIQRLLQSLLGLRGPALWFVIGLIVLDCVGVNISVGGVLLDPFVRYQLFLVGLGIGAADRIDPYRIGLLHSLSQANFLSRVPEPHRMAAKIGGVVLLLSALPELEVSIRPFRINSDRAFLGALSNALIVGSFYYVGRALPGLIAARSLADVSRTTAWNSAPVKAGLGAAILCIVGALAVVGGTLAYEYNWAKPPLVETPRPNPVETPRPPPTLTPSPTPAPIPTTPTPSQATPAPPQTTPTPAEDVSKAKTPTGSPNIPRFRCFPTPSPGEYIRYRHNPQTGSYDLDPVRVPASECLAFGESEK